MGCSPLNRIEEKINKEKEAYMKHPEVYKYFSNDSSCVICLKNSLDPKLNSLTATAAFNPPIQNIATKMPVEKPVTAGLRHFLNRLGLITFKGRANLEIPASVQPSLYEHAEIYLRFLASIDLSSSLSCFKRFDEKIFADAFNLNVVDNIFKKFIMKLENDPLAYEKRIKTKVLTIFILALAYCNSHQFSTKRIKERIGEISFLFVPAKDFYIDIQDDPGIDAFILQLRKTSYDLHEAIFMNKAYLGLSKNKECIGLVHKRLVENIKQIEEQFIFSFLKHVFTYKTILFSCIGAHQLIKLIFSFYQNMNRPSWSIEIFTEIAEKTEDIDVYQAIMEILKALCLQNTKYEKLYTSFEIRSCSTFNDLIGFINTNNESFISMRLLVNDMKFFPEYALVDEIRVELLQLFVVFLKNIKSEFVDHFFNASLAVITDLLSKFEDIGGKMREFNQTYWDDLSDIVLLSQRMGMPNELEKKKRCIANKKTAACQLGLKLAACIYKIEEKAILSGVGEFKQLKERGFRI